MKIVLLLTVGAVAGALAVMKDSPVVPPFAPPETVAVETGEIQFRPLGNFSQGGKTRRPRRLRMTVPGFDIMKYQVTGGQYAACVADGACAPARVVAKDMPQTGVNWKDASDFAAWYSRRTGAHWRLPTEAEWQLAAAERYVPADLQIRTGMMPSEDRDSASHAYVYRSPNLGFSAMLFRCAVKGHRRLLAPRRSSSPRTYARII